MKRESRLDFPTPESPIRTTGVGGLVWGEDGRSWGSTFKEELRGRALANDKVQYSKGQTHIILVVCHGLEKEWRRGGGCFDNDVGSQTRSVTFV